MYICIYVGTPVCTHMHSYMHIHAGCSCMWRCKVHVGISSHHSLTTLLLYQWRQGLSVNPELADVFSLTSKLALEILCFYLLRLELQEGH